MRLSLIFYQKMSLNNWNLNATTANRMTPVYVGGKKKKKEGCIKRASSVSES